MELDEKEEQVKSYVRERYSEVARRSDREADPSIGECCCCGLPNSFGVEETSNATSIGYREEDLSRLPSSVLGACAGCGNPTALAELQEGEVILDLGSGGGIDVFIAAKKVGPTGRAIGVDMTKEMIKLARRNAVKMGLANVEFRQGEIEKLPVGDGSVDVIISNCVINLAPDKDAVFREAFRVLRPGGRMMVSDIVTDGELPAEIRNDPDAWARCIAGALDERVYLGKISAAGFQEVRVRSKRPYMGPCNSIDVEARKPLN